ncbi:penicillin-binding transpeptidase domain-containing protein [Leptospirillum ferrooxidans]|uniref:Putative penicillinbinding protein, transpeptidase n=1 Tax=Leptospirillum ferrooxidans (strain C2-3) TaxID=1162668 RepID=I0IN21_LEPFC|nr:penicillin-binding transpeptidase domain-containing protein [Leptospirillum ferrooxidans]BAM06670.1 putative penicillinbinding protein, transpeptidase [Leptospirillum ferrooxidans C2-3]
MIRRVVHLLTIIHNPISWTLGKRIFSLFILISFWTLPTQGGVPHAQTSVANASVSLPKEQLPKLLAVSTPSSASAGPDLLGSVVSGHPDVLNVQGKPAIRFNSNLPVLDPDFLPSFHTPVGDHFETKTDEGYVITWTVRPSLQKDVAKFVLRNRVPYGMFVAVDPKTGAFLAFYGSQGRTESDSLVQKASYPAASMFKVVTTADALENRKINPDTEIYFHGCLYCIGPAYWTDNRRRDRLHLTVTEALGKSVNMIFAKIALRYLTPQNLQSMADRFGFNKEIDSDVPFEMSSAVIPSDRAGFARSAAGFGQVLISPIHAAVIAGALSNGGVMMRPHLIESIKGPDGKVFFQPKPQVLAVVADARISSTLLSMMHSTTVKGTGRRAFFRWHNDPILRKISVAGKTGTLSGLHPEGLYEWFMGMAPVGTPRIAVAALTIDRGYWRIKGTDIASRGLRTYFRKNADE